MSERTSAIAARWLELLRERRPALIPYLPAGFPTATDSLAALRAVAQSGADLLEVGVPFSDPLADGPTIQRATQAALAQGMTLSGVLALIREAAVSLPVVLMTYLNPVLAYGLERLLRDARDSGVAGLLVTDLPAGAAPEIERPIAAGPLDLIRLVAPTTPEPRLAGRLEGGGGFVYLISRLGVTGARPEAPHLERAELAAQVGRIRRVSALPVVVGFGVSTPAQAAAVAGIADGVVVGSALVDALAQGGVAAAAGLTAALAGSIRDARRSDAA